MLRLKSTFYGVICDWENQAFIDTETKTLTIDKNTCQYIAKNTIEFSYAYHFKILKELY